MMEYKIEMREESGYPLEIAELHWTTDLPTVGGWYWVIGNGEEEPFPDYVFFDEKEKGLCINVLGYALLVKEIERHWLGPLPVPEPPERD